MFTILIRAAIVGSWHAVKNKAVNLMLITIWIIYPDVSSAIFSSLACVDFGEGYGRLWGNLRYMLSFYCVHYLP